ncbi:MAG: amidohydrolase family protein, partial [Promethearchaeota archaeon]
MVLPGLIDSHTHLSTYLSAAFTDNLFYRKMEENRISALEETLSGEQCYYGALLGCLEMIKSGTTFFLD